MRSYLSFFFLCFEFVEFQDSGMSEHDSEIQKLVAAQMHNSDSLFDITRTGFISNLDDYTLSVPSHMITIPDDHKKTNAHWLAHPLIL